MKKKYMSFVSLYSLKVPKQSYRKGQNWSVVEQTLCIYYALFCRFVKHEIAAKNVSFTFSIGSFIGLLTYRTYTEDIRKTSYCNISSKGYVSCWDLFTKVVANMFHCFIFDSTNVFISC